MIRGIEKYQVQEQRFSKAGARSKPLSFNTAYILNHLYVTTCINTYIVNFKTNNKNIFYFSVYFPAPKTKINFKRILYLKLQNKYERKLYFIQTLLYKCKMLTDSNN